MSDEAEIFIKGSGKNMIHVYGDIEASFHVDVKDPSKNKIALPNGTLLGFRIDEKGIWRFNPIRWQDSGSGTWVDFLPSEKRTSSEKSDLVRVFGAPFKWIVIGEAAL